MTMPEALLLHANKEETSTETERVGIADVTMMMTILVMTTVVKEAVIVITKETGTMTAHHVVTETNVARESHVLLVTLYHSQHNLLTQHMLGTCPLK
jgi:hypothetical protein